MFYEAGACPSRQDSPPLLTAPALFPLLSCGTQGTTYKGPFSITLNWEKDGGTLQGAFPRRCGVHCCTAAAWLADSRGRCTGSKQALQRARTRGLRAPHPHQPAMGRAGRAACPASAVSQAAHSNPHPKPRVARPLLAAMATRRLGGLPVMTRTRACHLAGLDRAGLVGAREEANEMGGYFVCNGIERIIRNLIAQVGRGTWVAGWGWDWAGGWMGVRV